MAAKQYMAVVTAADILSAPDNGYKIDRRDSQLLFGESFLAEDEQGDFIFGTSLADLYRGYIHRSKLAPDHQDATHFVDIPLTHIYPEADFKTRPVMALGFRSRLRPDVSKTQNGFTALPGFGWVFTAHISPLTPLRIPPNIADTALLFLGCPYLYGGRSALGIDCSGLSQLSVMRMGEPCARDTAEQQNSVGQNVTDRSKLRRGDLVYFKGHVGIMLDEGNIINATSRTMDVRIEKLSDLKKIYDGILSVRRI